MTYLRSLPRHARAAALTLGLAVCPAFADPATIEAVEARRSGPSWTFSVTVRHADTGWDDYADGWRIRAPDGRILGTRVLAHPHVEEQPFTRSLPNVTIPEGLAEVAIEVSTSTGGWEGALYPVALAD